LNNSPDQQNPPQLFPNFGPIFGGFISQVERIVWKSIRLQNSVPDNSAQSHDIHAILLTLRQATCCCSVTTHL
jgi:hypothetical protein